MLPFLVITPVLIAVWLYMLSTNKMAKIIAILFQLVMTVVAFYLVFEARGGELIDVVGAYDAILGIPLRADTLAATFVLLTTIIFLLVSIYSLNQHESRTFWFLLFLLEAAFIGLFLTRDLFNIFVLGEVSTVTMAILLMYYRERRNMYYGMVFLVMNIVAMQFYLFGIGYMYMLTGGLDIAYISSQMYRLDRSDLILPYALMMTKIGFKCALVPLLSWTPKVRVYPNAPTAVMAVMSGLQIKSAIYLLIRFQNMFEPIAAQDLFLIIGIITGFVGVVMAVSQTDIRMILAYHTISQAGLIIIGISSGAYYSFVGGLYHIISHAMFKTPLFLSAGIIIHSFGTGDVYKLKGVARRMPWVSAGCIAAVLGITGAPLFIGSMSKYFLTADVPFSVNAAVVIISLGTIISFIKFSGIFFGRSELKGDIIKPELCRTIPVLILGFFCLFGGIFAPWFIQFLFQIPVEISIMSYLQKMLIFAFSVAVGLLLYKKVIKGNAHLVRLGAINVGFRKIIVGMCSFFAMLLLYGFFNQ